MIDTAKAIIEQLFDDCQINFAQKRGDFAEYSAEVAALTFEVNTIAMIVFGGCKTPGCVKNLIEFTFDSSQKCKKRFASGLRGVMTLLTIGLGVARIAQTEKVREFFNSYQLYNDKLSHTCYLAVVNDVKGNIDHEMCYEYTYTLGQYFFESGILNSCSRWMNRSIFYSPAFVNEHSVNVYSALSTALTGYHVANYLYERFYNSHSLIAPCKLMHSFKEDGEGLIVSATVDAIDESKDSIQIDVEDFDGSEPNEDILDDIHAEIKSSTTTGKISMKVTCLTLLCKVVEVVYPLAIASLFAGEVGIFARAQTESHYLNQDLYNVDSHCSTLMDKNYMEQIHAACKSLDY